MYKEALHFAFLQMGLAWFGLEKSTVFFVCIQQKKSLTGIFIIESDRRICILGFRFIDRETAK